GTFVGRAPELAQLRTTFDQTRTGVPSIAIVTGRSGIGKSALVRYFVEALRRDEQAVVLAGRCYERESLPFKGIDSVIDSLCRYLVRLPEAEVSRLLPRNVRALSRLFPVLRQVEVIENMRFRIQEVPDPQELRRRGFAALRELLARLADHRPVVMCIDDAHWGDEDSAQLLQHLLQPPDAPAVLLVCCHRKEGNDGPVLHELAKLADSIPLHSLELGPLPEAEGAELVYGELAALGVEASPALDAHRIAAEAEGSPFFIGELVLAFQREARSSPLPPATQLSLDHVLRDRILLLPPVARRLLEVVAAAGRPIEQGLALAAAESGPRGPTDLDALRSAHFIRTHGTRDRDPLECYHDRVRQAVLGQIDADALRVHHQRLGQLIEEAGRFQSDALAEHFFLAGDAARATRYALQAAREAAEALAFDRAALLYRRVISLGVTPEAERAQLFAGLGEVLVHAGRSADAAEAYLEASRLVAPELAFELERKAAEHYLRSGHVDQGLALLRRVLGAIDLALPKSPQRALISLLLRRVRLGMRGLGYVERDEKSVSRSLLARIDTCWSASVGLGLIDFVRGGDFQTRHCLLALEAGEPYRLARALALEAGYLAADGGKTEARVRDVLDLADRILARHAHPHAHALTRLARGMAAWHLGHFRESMPLCEQAERIFREQCRGATWEIATTQVFEAVARYYL
ncbi:MAG TPA: AAA family ATPase, partial [Polyangiales bacterium]|nr:AAA family ATPase [Polyangiales bacterium]